MTQTPRQGQEVPVPIIDLSRCTGCALCVKACPAGALAMHAGGAYVVRPEACQYTGLCEQICPEQAITRLFEIILQDTSSVTDEDDATSTLKPTKVEDEQPQG